MNIRIRTRDGTERTIAGAEGRSLMEIMREHGIDELLAPCGGCCCCATCHVYVDPDFADRLPNPSEDEREMLRGSPHRTQWSRLSCQIRCSESLDGLGLQIAPQV